MVRDVYAGDDASPRESAGRRVRFRVVADADPGVVGRVAQQLAFANVAPSEFHMSLDGAGCAEIRATLAGVAPETCDYIHRKLWQLALVHSVDIEPPPAAVRPG